MRRYDNAPEAAPRTEISLYRPVLFDMLARKEIMRFKFYLLMTKPVKRPPKAFPITDGIRWAPALVTDACADTWKYMGTKSII